ncbi:hypothetical protein NRS6120_07745 [Bacillus subtilis]|nr:hypothetical protein NRS6120_07745 [Bacillus subtilis]
MRLKNVTKANTDTILFQLATKNPSSLTKRWYSEKQSKTIDLSCIISVKKQKMTGAEALIRLVTPDGQLRTPGEFIGVENAAQKQLLYEKGCDHLQGFFFSRPIPPEQFEQFIIEQPSQ